VKKIIIFIITLYQKYISPIKPATCRFYPTCSEYAIQALTEFGLIEGVWLSVKRISRCHPFNPGGYDPLPDSSRINHVKK
jgi:putative membrane protein insertion efficiency factor